MKNFKQLKVWQRSHKLVIEIYRITKMFPSDERFGLISQLRRSAASIPANIAEGYGRSGDREFLRFLSIAAGSANETEYHLLLAYDLKYIEQSEYLKLEREIKEIRRMLSGLMKKIAASSQPPAASHHQRLKAEG
jgi:four helix bundle protein